MKTVKKIVIALVMLSITVALPSIVPQQSTFGKMFLPMHTTVLLSAYIVGGPLAMVIGAVSPLLRHSIVGLPEITVALPMCFELAAYGLVAGLIYSRSNKRGRDIIKSLLLAMVSGRFIWAIAAYNYQASTGVQVTFNMVMTETVINAIPGIMIQLFAVSLIVYGLRKFELI